MGSLDREDVINLWRWLPARYGAVVTQKQGNPVMEGAARLLSMLGVMDDEAFMTRYSTTLGSTIYLCFEPGTPTVSLLSQACCCAHECLHVEQALRIGTAKMWTRYARSGAHRAALEAEAYSQDMILASMCGIRYTPEHYRQILRAYSCGVEAERLAVARWAQVRKACDDHGFRASYKQQKQPASLAAQFLGVL